MTGGTQTSYLRFQVSLRSNLYCVAYFTNQSFSIMDRARGGPENLVGHNDFGPVRDVSLVFQHL